MKTPARLSPIAANQSGNRKSREDACGTRTLVERVGPAEATGAKVARCSKIHLSEASRICGLA